LKHTKQLSLIILGLLFLLPFINVYAAQEDYVEIQEGYSHKWRLGLYSLNWDGYFNDNLEYTLENLFPLGSSVMTEVYMDWVIFQFTAPPQSYWPFNIIDVGDQETGKILFPFDNTTFSSTTVNASAGYEVREDPFTSHHYIGSWYIVNDTSSFLRQTLNLTLAFSVYGILNVPIAPITINWTSFIIEFLEIMKSKGGLYSNISATALSNGYSLHVPVQGFESNREVIDIDVIYNPNGILEYYEFSYGGKMLVNFRTNNPSLAILTEGDLLTILWSGIFIVIVISIVLVIQRFRRKPVYVGGI
jgi:hypothetical protein